MTELGTRLASAEETEQWLKSWRERWEAEYGRTRSEPRFDSRAKRHADSPDATLLRLTREDEPVGFLGVSTVSDYGAPSAILDDIFIEPQHRRQGLGTAARRIAEEWAKQRTTRLQARIDGVSPAQLALFRDYPLGGQSMVKDLTEAPKLPDGVGVRPMTEAEYATWTQRLVIEYAQSFVDAGILTPHEATRRAQTQTENLLPQGQATPEHSLLTLAADGSPAGSIWLRHNISPGMSYVFDVTVEENQRGKGLGRAVMLAGEAVSLAAGDSRLGLHVFGHNTVAMRLYESLGYEIVDQLRALTIDQSA